MSKMNIAVGIKGLKAGTKLNEIVVPKEMRVRMSCGISWLDDALGEGFVASTVAMFTGTPGAGKSTGLLMLADSLTKQGHIVLLNTGEESLYQVKMVSERLELKGDFHVAQHDLVGDLLKEANVLAKKNPGKKVFILQDSLQTLDDGKWSNGTNSMTPVRCTEMLVDWAKSTYNCVVFVGQVTKSGEFAGKQTIKHAVDVHFHLYIDDEKKSETYGDRLFEVTKNRYGVSGRTYILGMNKKGLYEMGSFKKGE
jgi:DNA repair protein RadA/Sms